MGLGCITLFIGALYPMEISNDAREAINKTESMQALSERDEDNRDMAKAMTGTGKALASTATATPIPSKAPLANPTPPPVYELNEGGNPEIENLLRDYYVAWNSCDYSLIKDMSTDPDNAIPLSQLQRETRFLDDIRDNTYYIMKSYEEGSYIVYAYYEIKYVNIKTTLPRLDKFYIVTDEEGDFNIFCGEMDEKLKTYYEERDQDENIQEIIQRTNDKAKDALNNDLDLRVYVEALFNN